MNTQDIKHTEDDKWSLLKELVEQTGAAAQALNRMTDAVIYLADVIGGKADAAKMTVSAPLPKELKDSGSELDPTPAQTKTADNKTEPSMTDVRNAMNAYARKNGKAKAMELIDKYSPTRKVEDIDPAQYGALLMEASA